MRLAALFLVTALGGCDAAITPDPLGETMWALVSGAEAAGAQVRFESGGFTAYPVCNSVWGTYSAGRNRLALTTIGSTRAFCGEGAAAEAAFVRALERVRAYEMRGDRLVLTGGGVRLEFERR